MIRPRPAPVTLISRPGRPRGTPWNLHAPSPRYEGQR
ncbi:hypothetical protein EDD96_3009 [Streptomyces sp. Ag109_G2-6]|nr:hypothetical protein EDD96_3009 [Streptomyces sp. Ag109_G2-6]